MMSLLGLEWRKLSKTEQQEWTKRAAEELADPHQKVAEGHSNQDQQQAIEEEVGEGQAFPYCD